MAAERERGLRSTPAAGAGGAAGKANLAGTAATAARSGNPYSRLLRIPGALRFVVAGFVGRMPMAMIGLGIVLLVSAVTGRYGTAGAVAATGSICYAILVPRLGKLTDRFGQARVLRPLAAVFAASAVAFVACARERAPIWTLFVTGGALGATMPSLGSMVRARWSYLLGGSDNALLHTAFSLESVADELIFITGPAIVTILATKVDPTVGVLTAAVLSVTGTLIFASQRRTEPPVRPRAHREHSAIRVRGMLVFVTIYAFLGAMFGTIDLSTVAFASEHGHRALAGFVLGTYALGSAAGGLWYGSRQWRAPLDRRFMITLVGVAAGVAPMMAVNALPVMFAVVPFSGMFIAPTLIAGFGLIERRVPPQLMTEGMSWLSTSIGVGLALGTPVAGRIIDAKGAHWGYAFALCCGVASAAVCLAGVRRVRLPVSGGSGPSAIGGSGVSPGQRCGVSPEGTVPPRASRADMVAPCEAAQPARPARPAEPVTDGATGQATSRPAHAGQPPLPARSRSRQPFGRPGEKG
jgi:predicted MFS family arabinose efflux permease